jgi:hypothetical protein
MGQEYTDDLSWIPTAFDRTRFLRYIRMGYRVHGNHLSRRNNNGSTTYILMYRRQFTSEIEKPIDDYGLGGDL